MFLWNIPNLSEYFIYANDDMLPTGALKPSDFFYGNKINIRLIEKIAHKEFYKYISYNKRKDVYHVIYGGFVRSTHKKLINALYERDLIIKYDGDEELMCEDSTIIHDYKK